MPPAEQPPQRAPEGRFARHLRLVRVVIREPGRLIPIARGAVVDAWRTRGGGFYGLGYLVAFVWLQVNVLVGDVMESESVGAFAAGAALEYLLRFSLMAFLNVFLALLWPLFVLQQFGGPGIIVLGLGYVAFEYALRPLVEQYFPELKPESTREMRDSVSQNPEQ